MARREAEHTVLPIPNGWFAVAYSRDLIPGDVKAVRYVGHDLVVFRTRSGQARVLDAYCPHLGAHLGEGGRVMGETVRCPFHGWQYDGASGECTKIPYCERIPPRARVRAWETQEKNGLIFLWHHSEGKPPEWDFPALPEFGNPDWSEPRLFDLELGANVQDTHENNNDPVHFQVVHGMMAPPDSQLTYSPDGRHYVIRGKSEFQAPGGPVEIDLVRDSWGLGLTAVRMAGFENAGLLMYSSTTPIDEERVHSRWLLTATNNLVDVAGEEFMQSMTTGVTQDFRIWANKVHRAKPVLCEADTFLAEYRKWVRQFYTEPA